MRNIVVVVAGGVVLLILIIKEVLDLAATIDYVEQKWPRVVKWAERKPWQRILLLILTIMYGGILYEMWTEPAIVMVIPPADVGAKDAKIAELGQQLRTKCIQSPNGASTGAQGCALKLEPQRTTMLALRVQVSPEEPGRFSRHFLLITNRDVAPVRMLFGCAKATIYSVQPVPLPPGAMLGGAQSMGDGHNFAISINAPIWSPIQPLVIEAVIDKDDAVSANCYVKPL